MERARAPAVRRRRVDPAARRRGACLEARLDHPIFQPLHPWLQRLVGHTERPHDELNRLAAERALRTESGHAARFVPPGTSGAPYETRIFDTGCIATRPSNWHDFFNALVWLAFPRTKARINALHARQMPQRGGRRGPLRDLLTLFDEGGAIVVCDDPELLAMLMEMRWKKLFWDHRARVLASMRFIVLGHAVLEKALDPWAGVTCKAISVPAGSEPDLQAAAWLGALPPDASPRLLFPLPVFGYPGWLEGSDQASFYDDERYFRPLRRSAATGYGKAG